MSFVIVIDPAHSDYPQVDDFEPSRSASVVAAEENAITLRLAEKILKVIELAEIQTDSGKPVEVHLTRRSDENPCQADRANVAKTAGADISLSLQFNNFDANMRGTQAWIDRKYHDGHQLKVADPVTYATLGPGQPSSGVRNTNHVDILLQRWRWLLILRLKDMTQKQGCYRPPTIKNTTVKIICRHPVLK